MSNDSQHTSDCQATRSFVSPDATGPFQSSRTTPASAAAAADLPAIPGYELSRELARGGMGRIVVGSETSLRREVAIKMLLPGANAERFISESKITAQLPHPSIPPIYRLGMLDDGSPYLAMKFIHGRTLDAELKARPNPLHALPRFVQVFEQICQAVGFAHAQQIIHRDLKPTNIMLGAFGEVQVMDWGLAKEMRQAEPETTAENLAADEGNDSADLTQIGTVLGTPNYMAPEQARGEEVDTRADVFTLGGILCNVLTGRAVHSGGSVQETIHKAAAGDLSETLARLDACGADAELVRIASSCLAADRQQRPANGQAVALLIATYRQGVEERLHRVEAERAAALVREAEQQKRRRQFFRLGGAAAAVLIMGIVGTSIGLVRANRAADAERVAKTKAETRLNFLRTTLGTFANELPNLGQNLPLSEALRQEMLAFSKKLVTAIGEQHEMNDTYEFAVNAITLRECIDAQTRGDYVAARAKAVSARDGFQQILDSNPQFFDRARNNFAAALAQLGRLDRIDEKYREAEANLRQALSLQRSVRAERRGDIALSAIDAGLVTILQEFGFLEFTHKQYDAATALWREANDLIEKNLQTEHDKTMRETLRLNWVQTQINFSRIAFATNQPKEGLRIYETIVKQLAKEVKAEPNSAALRSALARDAEFLGDRLVYDNQDYQRAVEMYALAAHNHRWFWNSKEITELAEKLGSNYYLLGVYALRNKQPVAAKKYFQDCLSFWDLGVNNLEEQGVPANSKELLGRKTVQMLARGRCGMVNETAQFAAELLARAQESDKSPLNKRSYATQSAVGYGMCAVTFSPGSKERIDYFKKAMVSLRQGVEVYGYKDWRYLETDDDFDPLREWPEFQQAIDEWRARDARRK